VLLWLFKLFKRSWLWVFVCYGKREDGGFDAFAVPFFNSEDFSELLIH